MLPQDTAEDIYSHFIQPIIGAKQWCHVENMEPILPSMLRKPPGKPHKNKRKNQEKQLEINSRSTKKTCNSTVVNVGS